MKKLIGHVFTLGRFNAVEVAVWTINYIPQKIEYGIIYPINPILNKHCFILWAIAPYCYYTRSPEYIANNS